MVRIEANAEWLDFCTNELDKAKRKAAKKVYDKYGNVVLFPMFLHVDLCNVLHNIFATAPNKTDALEFVRQALNEVEEHFKDKV